MIAVGCPIAGFTVFALFTHDDDRVEKAAQLGDDGLEFARVSVREISLIRSRLDFFDGERSHDEPVTTEGLAVRRQNSAAVFFNRRLQVTDVVRCGRNQEFSCFESDRLAGKFSTLSYRPRLFLRFFLSHNGLCLWCLLNIASVTVPGAACSARISRSPRP